MVHWKDEEKETDEATWGDLCKGGVNGKLSLMADW